MQVVPQYPEQEAALTVAFGRMRSATASSIWFSGENLLMTRSTLESSEFIEGLLEKMMIWMKWISGLCNSSIKTEVHPSGEL
jgi:hypothetical protein